MINFGAVPASNVLPIPFDSFAAATGANVTITGLAIGDVLIYKGTSMTQRSSTAGIVLMDTDGIDLDGITGINGFSIDLGDNTDAGFYAVGSYYWVLVSLITVDGQAISFVVATFRIIAAENTAGFQNVDAGKINNVSTSPVTTVKAVQGLATDGVVPTVTNLTNNTPTAGTITTVTNLTNAPTVGDLTAVMKTSVGTAALAQLTSTIPDSIPADGTRPSIQQALYMITQFLTEGSVSGVTYTVRKADGSTSLFTLTLDDATNPTSITRAT